MVEPTPTRSRRRLTVPRRITCATALLVAFFALGSAASASSGTAFSTSPGSAFSASPETAFDAPSAAAGYCDRRISSDGKSIRGICTNDWPGTSFRFLVTTCGPSYCRDVAGPWWPQGRWSAWWNTGGYIAGVLEIQFR